MYPAPPLISGKVQPRLSVRLVRAAPHLILENGIELELQHLAALAPTIASIQDEADWTLKVRLDFTCHGNCRAIINQVQ